MRSKLLPDTRYLICPGDKVRDYRENTKTCNGPYEVTKVSNKIISDTDGIKIKQFNITSVLPMPPKTNDLDTKHDMNKIEEKELIGTVITIPIRNANKIGLKI